MAYINEFVPKEEERTFDLGYGRKKTPGIWTIDKDKGYIFFKDYTEIDEPVNQHFVFVYKNEVITMILNGEEFDETDTRIWKIGGITIPEEFSREEVLDELRKAVVAYGSSGQLPNYRFGFSKAKAGF